MIKPSQYIVSAIALLATTVAATSTVLAADLPPPPPMRPAQFDWSGPYVGALAGINSTDNKYVAYENGVPADPELNGDGISGGVMAGYNYQYNNIVAGVESDIMWGDLDPKDTNSQVSQKINQIATVRARLGYAHDNTLFYATGGVGFLRSKIRASFDHGGGVITRESKKKNHIGYVVGGGIEHGLTDNILLRAEYLYGDFGKKTYNYTTFPNTKIKADLKGIHMFRFGAAYKF